MDDDFEPEDLSKESQEQAQKDIDQFIEKAGSLLNNLNMKQVMYDFWLTRNGHGTGFWDRKLGEIGEKLTKIAESFGECHLYVGDDGNIYMYVG